MVEKVVKFMGDQLGWLSGLLKDSGDIKIIMYELNSVAKNIPFL